MAIIEAFASYRQSRTATLSPFGGLQLPVLQSCRNNRHSVRRAYYGSQMIISADILTYGTRLSMTFTESNLTDSLNPVNGSQRAPHISAG
jgi:hypothetical protein